MTPRAVGHIQLPPSTFHQLSFAVFNFELRPRGRSGRPFCRGQLWHIQKRLRKSAIFRILGPPTGWYLVFNVLSRRPQGIPQLWPQFRPRNMGRPWVFCRILTTFLITFCSGSTLDLNLDPVGVTLTPVFFLNHMPTGPLQLFTPFLDPNSEPPQGRTS